MVKQKSHFPTLVGYIILFVLGGVSIYTYSSASSLVRMISGTYGSGAHVLGIFDRNPGDGNGGKIILIDKNDELLVNGSGIYVDIDPTSPSISGNFFLQTVGWVYMNTVPLIPPANKNVTTPWLLSGYAWSENAGYIDFVAQDTSYPGVGYIPGTQTFTGYAWSPTLGYIDLSPQNNDQFKNKVKILGNISSNRLYNTEYSIGAKFSTLVKTSSMNTLRRNISLLTRNLPTRYINTGGSTLDSYNDILYYKVPVGTQITEIGIKMNNAHARTLIIEGGDAVIDSDITIDPQIEHPRSIVVIGDANGNGGNIYIKGSVKNIYSSLIAEGSIYTGDSASNLYNDTIAKLTNLPVNQLYIYGSIISNNSIGGSSQNPASCPYIEKNCSYNTSLKYDWNYFRTFDGQAINRSDKTGYDAYSMVIEADPRIVQDPPPGMAQ